MTSVTLIATAVPVTATLITLMIQMLGKPAPASGRFRYPLALQVFLYSSAVLMGLVLPAYVQWANPDVAILVWTVCLLIGCTMLFGAVQASRYFIQLDECGIAVREFKCFRINYSSVTSVKMVKPISGPDYLEIRHGAEGKLVVYGYLPGLDHLYESILAGTNAHLQSVD